MSFHDRSPEEIRRDIERTRVELTNTVNELVNRLDPRVVTKNVANSAKEKTLSVAETVKEKVIDAKDIVRAKSHDMVDAVRDVAQDVKSSVASSFSDEDKTNEGAVSSGKHAYDTYPEERSGFSGFVSGVVNDAREGEPKALGIIAGAGIAVLGVAVLTISR
ncbi:DUF3618 domain-containing protein [Actinotignum urinale]|uniref:DUF3618 domain-containing protein n=1 Tax=Actinotignum urinale TaxID=190146 RepID=A0AAW9HWK4_9ACTO|nr:DUF3618 domain-containing protein [Actinotignum urinale]MDY5129315.1 DUF3618 domain-containing protein [Actinotignum urinale]MDY5154399.1 DUF3618 domain-containing protein [Actinotignum urinale]